MKVRQITLAFLLISLFTTISCDNSGVPPVNENDNHNLISYNLLKNGNIDPTLLIGEWNCVKFAYTTDGNSISDVATISKGNLTIPFVPTPIENNIEDRWCLSHTNQDYYVCSLSDNLIQLTLKGSTFAMPPQEEIDITFALENAYSFVVRGNELIIYFIGIENKNLLILKKR